MRYLLISTIMPLLIVAALWLLSSRLPPTDGQLQALAVLADPTEFEGSNAFPILWLLAYDVPESELDAVIAADIKALERVRPESHTAFQEPPFRTLAAERYPDLRPNAEDQALFCPSRNMGCLERVRANPMAYRQLILQHRRLLDRIAALAEHDHVQSLFAPDLIAPTPWFQMVSFSQTEHALAFAEQRVEEALSGTCRDLLAWQRLGTHTDTLLVRMIGQAFAGRTYPRLLADMLAELPTGHPLPADCQALLHPPEADMLRMCRPMQGEFRMLAALIAKIGASADPRGGSDYRLDPLSTLTYRPNASIARSAPLYAQWCSEEMIRSVAADDPKPELLQPPGLLDLRCLSNWSGCVMAGIATSSHFLGYHVQHLDYGARRRLLSALLWLQENTADESPEDAFARLPEQMQSLTRPLRLDTEQGRLVVDLHRSGEEEYFALPLPGSRLSLTRDQQQPDHNQYEPGGSEF